MRFTALLLVAFLAAGCASSTRRLAVVDYQIAKTASAAVDATSTAQKAGLVSAPEYRKFLDAADKLAQAGSAYSHTLAAYLAAPGGSLAQLQAALLALIAQFTALPAPLTGSAQTQVQSLVGAQAPQKAIADAKSAAGVK